MDFNLGAGFNLLPGDAIRFPVELVARSHIHDEKYADATSDGFMALCHLLPCHTLCKSDHCGKWVTKEEVGGGGGGGRGGETGRVYHRGHAIVRRANCR